MSVIVIILFGLSLVCGDQVLEDGPREKRSSVCYGDLGCFSSAGPFTGLYRPIHLDPQSPKDIDSHFLLYTRNSQPSFNNIHYDDFAGLSTSGFNASKPTKFIVHGFLDNGHSPWMKDMKDELLKNGDYNVVIVDWGGGSGIPYTQATANTRVVGAELAKLIQGLQSNVGAKANNIHLIGHSLGAHICGYAGERTLDLGRITGLDPADPYFQYMDKVVRLDPSDANFVDVIHTNGASMLTLGYGMVEPCGHVDYFPNNGLNQPGCDADPITKLRLEGDIYEGGKEVVACSHLRAYRFFTESINSRCPFNGYGCADFSAFVKGQCLPCSGTNCGQMGFYADRIKPAPGKTHVKYYLQTGDASPFCRYHYKIGINFGQLPGAKTETGTLYMNLMGNSGQTGETQIDADPIDIQPGHSYGFVVTAPNDIGDLNRVTFRWETDSHWYNPLTWSLLSHHAMHINYIDVVNGETDRRYLPFNKHYIQDRFINFISFQFETRIYNFLNFHFWSSMSNNK